MSRNEPPASCSNDLMMEIMIPDYPEATWSTEVWEDGHVFRLKEVDWMTVSYELADPDGRIDAGIKRDRESAIEEAKYRLEAKKVADLDDDELGPAFYRAVSEGNEVRAGAVGMKHGPACASMSGSWRVLARISPAAPTRRKSCRGSEIMRSGSQHSHRYLAFWTTNLVLPIRPMCRGSIQA
jgi:hypothetical protein